MRKTELSDLILCTAISEIEQGLIDADLGAGIIKKRISISGRGKSGGIRALIATNRNDHWFFVFGFRKNERANISVNELKALQLLSTDLLKLSSVELDDHVESGALKEICHDY